MEYQTVINNKTGVTHYVDSRHVLDNVPYPICGNTVNSYPKGYPESDAGYAHYSFSSGIATCRRCASPNAESWFLEQVRPRYGWWTEQLHEANRIARICLCPFQAFAKKHGYDLKHDRLIFPKFALEFKDADRYVRNKPPNPLREEWLVKNGEYPGALPSHVEIGYVGNRTRRYTDKVALVKFMTYDVEATIVPWELIIDPWPEGSHCDVEFVTKAVRGETVVGNKPVVVHPYMKQILAHMKETSLFGMIGTQARTGDSLQWP